MLIFFKKKKEGNKYKEDIFRKNSKRVTNTDPDPDPQQNFRRQMFINVLNIQIKSKKSNSS
jgi:hypothetical protein